MKHYSSPKVGYVQLYMEERIAAGCMDMVYNFVSSIRDCGDYTAVEAGKPCCASIES